jgi:DNA-binding SARP family transcriptional activator
VEFRILGPLEVVDGGAALPLGGAKQRGLLAVLLLHAGEVVSSDRLIDQLWGETPPATAAKVVQVYVSGLRKALGSADILLTRGRGYVLALESESYDLRRFEQLVQEGSETLAAGDARAAAAILRAALDLWRGPALADFAYEQFAQNAIARLEELRLAAIEARIEADLTLGRHGELVGELESLVAEHPLRERLRGQQMLALYRSGRQAEALDAYQGARRVLVEGLGIEPSPALQELVRSILRQDAALDLQPPEAGQVPGRSRDEEPSAPERSILVVPREEPSVAGLIALAEPLAVSRPARELIVTRLIVAETRGADELRSATRQLRTWRDALASRKVAVRAAAFTSPRPAEDVVRLASEEQVDLLLLDCPLDVLREQLPHGEIGLLLGRAPCDVGLLVGGARLAAQLAGGRSVLVPFGGAEHEWAGLELGAWIAKAHGLPLGLVGVEPPAADGRRDASRLLADASLIVQRLAGIVPEPFLVEPGPRGVARAAAEAGLLVVGLSDRWRLEGLGDARLALAEGSDAPILFARQGMRPGGLVPRGSLTRFTWSLADGEL